MSETNMIDWLEYASMVNGTTPYSLDYNRDGLCECGLLTSDCPDAYTHMSQGY